MAGTIETTEATGRDSLGGASSPLPGPIRLAIGLVQGAGLWWLQQSSEHINFLKWPATQPMVFGPLLLVVAFLPIVLLAGVGRIRPRTLILWAIVAAVVLALLGLHDVARQSVQDPDYPPYLSPPLILFAIAALFIGHHLVAPADHERRWIASFPAYFDTTWKAGVQLALSIGFTGVFWILLFLGAALFRIIGLKFLEDLIRQDWFWVPVTTFVFAVAVHLTDVRDGLIRGVRTVVLMLLSWLLLVMTVLVAGFLAALPFTGLQGLWETGSATSLVLAAAAALIILINTAYQDGRLDNLPPMILRIAVRVAAVLITPLVVIAFWGLSLRIGQHGLTPDRIIAGACAVVGAAYAVGYGFAALGTFWRKGDWMRPLERTNVATALLSVLLILSLFSPLLDPARLSVADQVARLERGAVAADKFDYRFLRWESGKAGEAALARLARSTDAAVASRAKVEQKIENRYDDVVTREADRTPAIETWPIGTVLPPKFVFSAKAQGELRQCQPGEPCVAARRDLNGDGRPEILLAGRDDVEIYVGTETGDWRRVGFFQQFCRNQPRADPRGFVKSGKLRPLSPQWPDFDLGDGGQRARFTPDFRDCPGGTVEVPPTVAVARER